MKISGKVRQIIGHYRGVTDTDLIIFFRQLSVLFSTGIPILKICDLLESSQQNPKLRSIIFTIKQNLTVGQPLSESIKSFDIFDPICHQLISVGEHTGKLNHLFAAITTYLEKKQSWKRKIKEALFYPSILLFVACTMTFGLLLFVVPKFADLFTELNSTLPLITRFIFALSSFLQSMLWPTMLTLAGGIFFFRRQLSRHKTYLLQQILVIPPLNHYSQLLAITRFMRYLALTLDAGVPILDAITLSTCHMTSHRLKSFSIELCHFIQAGHPLHAAIGHSHLFPVFVLQMIKTGEESGKLVFLLNKASDLLEDDLNVQFSQLSQLLEPLIMLILGVLIGGLMTGMYLPIFKLGSTI